MGVKLTVKKLKSIRARARYIMRLDKRCTWKEAIAIVNYSVFEDGVNMIPTLVDEILRLRAKLKQQPP